MKTFMLCISLVAAFPVSAVNRCTAPDGRVTYTTHPCRTDEQGRYVDTTPNILDTSAQREHWLRQEEERAAAEAEAKRQARAARALPQQSSEAAEKSQACRDARRHLELEESATVGRRSVAIQTARASVEIACNAPSTPGYACSTALWNYQVEGSITSNKPGQPNSPENSWLEKNRQLAESACGRKSIEPLLPKPPKKLWRYISCDRLPGAQGVSCPDGFYSGSHGGYYSPDSVFCTGSADHLRCPIKDDDPEVK